MPRCLTAWMPGCLDAWLLGEGVRPEQTTYLRGKLVARGGTADDTDDADDGMNAGRCTARRWHTAGLAHRMYHVGTGHDEQLDGCARVLEVVKKRTGSI